MTKPAVLLIGFVMVFGSSIPVQDSKAVKVTVQIRGVVTNECAEALRGTLGKLNGIKIKIDDIQAAEQGKFKHYFSMPLLVEIADLDKTDLGAIAKVVAETKTSKRGDVPPSLNLVLYAPGIQIEESTVVAVRESLAEVNGVDARAPGGTGAVMVESRFWVRLDGSGNARLAEIRAALRKANLNVQTDKP